MFKILLSALFCMRRLSSGTEGSADAAQDGVSPCAAGADGRNSEERALWLEGTRPTKLRQQGPTCSQLQE